MCNSLAEAHWAGTLGGCPSHTTLHTVQAPQHCAEPLRATIYCLLPLADTACDVVQCHAVPCSCPPHPLALAQLQQHLTGLQLHGAWPALRARQQQQQRQLRECRSSVPRPLDRPHN